MFWGIKGRKILERVIHSDGKSNLCKEAATVQEGLPALKFLILSEWGTLLNSLILALYHYFFPGKTFTLFSPLPPNRTPQQNISCVCLFISCSRRKSSTVFPPWPYMNMSQGWCFACRCKQMFDSVTCVLESCNWFVFSCGDVIHDRLSFFHILPNVSEQKQPHRPLASRVEDPLSAVVRVQRTRWK